MPCIVAILLFGFWFNQVLFVESGTSIELWGQAYILPLAWLSFSSNPGVSRSFSVILPESRISLLIGRQPGIVTPMGFNEGNYEENDAGRLGRHRTSQIRLRTLMTALVRFPQCRKIAADPWSDLSRPIDRDRIYAIARSNWPTGFVGPPR